MGPKSHRLTLEVGEHCVNFDGSEHGTGKFGELNKEGGRRDGPQDEVQVDGWKEHIEVEGVGET